MQNKKPSMGEYGYFLELHNRPNIYYMQTPNHYLEKVVHCLLPFFYLIPSTSYIFHKGTLTSILMDA